MPKISVIIPIYNVEQYLAKCLDSLVNQTLKDIEIICVNDCSTDNSLSIIEDYASKDDRIKIINHKTNGKWAAKARNTGLKNASGEFIYFIDGDDYIDNDYLEDMLQHVEENNLDTIVNINFIKEFPDKKLKSDFNFDKKGAFVSIKEFAKFPPSVCFRLFKKSFLQENKIEFPVGLLGQDVYFVNVCNSFFDKVFVYNGPWYHYIQREKSAMRQKDRGWHYIQIFKLIYDFLSKRKTQWSDFKLFCAEGLIIDEKEKFDFVKKYLTEIKEKVEKYPDFYNEYEMFFYNLILNTPDYAEFLKKYTPNMSLNYIKYTRKNEQINFNNNAR